MFSLFPPTHISPSDSQERRVSLLCGSAQAAAVCLHVGIQTEYDWWKAQSTESAELRAWINIRWAQHRHTDRERDGG